MIGIIGATGFTGKLVATELRKRGAQFFVAGRNEKAVRTLSEELDNCAWKIVDVVEPATYGVLSDCSTIINCAGPYSDYGEPIVREAVQRKCNYLDLTGEQSFIKLVYDKYDAAANSAGVCLIPACAFEYALGDSAANILCAEADAPNSIEIAYFMEGTNNTSAGTRKSIIRAVAAQGYQLRQGRLVESAPGAIHKKMANKTLISFPGGEILMIPKHHQPKEVTTYMATDLAPPLVGLIPMFAPGFLRLFGNILVGNAGTASPSLSARAQTKFKIVVTAFSAATQRSITIEGADPYGITAAIIAAAAVEIESRKTSDNPGSLPTGAIAPSMLAGPEFIRSASTEFITSWKQGN